jgi:hypothetical protein
MYPYMKFHLPSNSRSLITPREPEANYRFRKAVLLFYILQIIALIKAEHYGYEWKNMERVGKLRERSTGAMDRKRIFQQQTWCMERQNAKRDG